MGIPENSRTKRGILRSKQAIFEEVIAIRTVLADDADNLPLCLKGFAPLLGTDTFFLPGDNKKLPRSNFILTQVKDFHLF
jgi:hypothetical protein